MNHKNSSEEIKSYEKEFSDFLIEKINHAGGSLQFQHLSGILQQLRFEVRNAVASSKPELMKFLRTHTNIFKIDSKGVVSVVDSVSREERSVGDDDDHDSNNNAEQDGVVPAPKKFQGKINNGEGRVMKVNPQFAIIEVIKPMNTHVYFTPSEYGADKDSLFGLDIDLVPQTEVCFNAEHGHADYGIEYRATKVWRKPNSDDENIDTENRKTNKNVENLLNGKGIVDKFYKNYGFISVFDRKDETVLFYESSIENCNTNVAKILEVGDHVEFTAKLANAGSKAKWLALSVRKKTKPSFDQPTSNFAENNKNLDVSYSKKNRIVNHPGKIYAYADGAIIKFGKDQKADGDSSDYYLYGNKIKVSDIIWEFSEGDDVLFDAVKMKKLPGWKAYLVWIGEKPNCKNIPKVDYDSDEITEEQSSASAVSSDSSNSFLKLRTTYNKYPTSEKKENKRTSTIHARSNSKKSDKFKDEYKKEKNVRSKTKTNDQNISVNVSKFKKANYKSDKRNLTSNNFAKKYRNSHLTEDLNYTAKSKRNLLASVESAPNSHIENSEDSSEDDDKFHDATSNPRKFLIEEKYNSSSSSDEINEDNEVIQNSEKKPISKKASIKKFEDIKGEIVSVLCKAAIIRCSLLKREVDFVLSAFYLNGESAEEQQVIDLKEIIQIGDKVNFNCFEIIDDDGELFQKVTVAWMGPKPEVLEATPEDFISEYKLSVSLGTDMDEGRSESRNEVCHTEFKSSENSEDETACYYSETESTLNIMLGDKLNKSSSGLERKISENSNDSDHSSGTEDEEESLSNKIVRKLKMHGFFSEDSQIDLRIVHEIIDLVLEKNRIANSSSHTLNQDKASSEVFCSSCSARKISFSTKDINSKEAAVQTIITGEIIASRDDFRTLKKQGAKYSSG